MGTLSAYDRWLAYEPEWPDPIQCRACNNILDDGDVVSEDIEEDAMECDGVLVTYSVDAPESLRAILGDEMADSYELAQAPCGEEIAHPAHREIFSSLRTREFLCPCGHRQVETD